MRLRLALPLLVNSSGLNGWIHHPTSFLVRLFSWPGALPLLLLRTLLDRLAMLLETYAKMGLMASTAAAKSESPCSVRVQICISYQRVGVGGEWKAMRMTRSFSIAAKAAL